GPLRSAHRRLQRRRGAPRAEGRVPRGEGGARARAGARPPARGPRPGPAGGRGGPRRLRERAGRGARHRRADRPPPLARTGPPVTTPRRAPEVLLRRYWNDPDTPVVTAGLSV